MVFQDSLTWGLLDMMGYLLSWLGYLTWDNDLKKAKLSEIDLIYQVSPWKWLSFWRKILMWGRFSGFAGFEDGGDRVQRMWEGSEV